jgi:hypothetical protein
MGPSGKMLGHWGHPLKGDIETPSSFLSLWCLTTMKWVASYFCKYVPPHGAQSTRPTNHGLKPPKLWAKVNSPALEIDYLRYFVLVTGSWLVQLISKIALISKLSYRFKLIPIKIPAGYSKEMNRLILNLYKIAEGLEWPSQFWKRTYMTLFHDLL